MPAFAGQLTIFLRDGGEIRSGLHQCIHCQYTWIHKPGSGRIRGFCTRCNGFVCGRKACRDRGCVHKMQMIENMEAGRPLDFAPIVVSVPVAPPTA